MTLKGLMLDMDGTLIHFQIDYQRARSKARQILEAYGYPPTFTEDNFILEMVKIAAIFFEKELHYPPEKITRIKKDVDDIVAEIEREASHLATPLLGIETMLDYAQNQGLKLGIITLNTSANAILSLETAGLAKYFRDSKLIVGRDRTPRTKPDIAHAHALLDEMQLDPSEVCLIGDHPSDIETANKVGARSIAVTSSKHPSQEFDTTFYTPQDNPSPAILSILESFLTNRLDI